MKSTELLGHPEGGRFKEIFRSERTVTNQSGLIRSALTHIYFSLTPGEVSRFHKVASDEVWNLYKGSGLYLYTWDGTKSLPKRITLSAKQNCFCHVVPAGIWQAAISISDTVLVGCSVAPGFEYNDFELIDPKSEKAKLLINLSSEMTKFVSP